MSSIDMTNPKVQQNILVNRMKEGKGEFVIRKEVLVFKDENGIESIPPKEVADNILAMSGVEPLEEGEKPAKKAVKRGRPKKAKEASE